MTAPAGLLLAHLLVSFVALHLFACDALFMQEKNAAFAVAAPAALMVVPVWSEVNTLTLVLAVAIVAAWAAMVKFIRKLHTRTTVSSALIVGALTGLWFGAYGLTDTPGLVTIIVSSAVGVTCVGLHSTSRAP